MDLEAHLDRDHGYPPSAAMDHDELHRAGDVAEPHTHDPFAGIDGRPAPRWIGLAEAAS